MRPKRESWLADQVGIRGIELYIPKLYITQKDLETFDNVQKGKYTVGLGQEEMSFCADHEDITSICLTVVSKLLKNYKLSASDIGFLCVGTETLTDKSKSVKTSLMKLFEENCDIEGVDVKNACYGGTQALFHAIDWIHANWEFERRYAIAVMADIAVYDAGPARCTGGAGAFAALIGPNAVLSFERGLRATYMVDVYDFYKPNQPVPSEYPIFEGQASLQAYLTAVDEAYKLYCQKSEKLRNEVVDISNFDAVFFHCPFTRLVQKALGVLAFIDFKRGLCDHLVNVERAKPSHSPDERALGGQRLLFFSYGSGAAAAMFSARILILEKDAEDQCTQMKRSANAAVALLEKRLCIDPKRYSEILALREKLLSSTAPYRPEGVRNNLMDEFSLFPNTYYLMNIGDKYRRYYAQTSS
ncbi:unnamed protein product [Acanthocheilonema viteae]|uniref:Hydroxymethylglutaryl-CoA synthase n=1 Tax=Acanthocheilonema viteae TaxID=6277 RepID=A0A498SPW6_ACAVI|nr:unnamed protein product [Acanthocheilonema viteae]